MEWLLIVGAFGIGFQIPFNQTNAVCIWSGVSWALIAAYIAFEVVGK